MSITKKLNYTNLFLGCDKWSNITRTQMLKAFSEMEGRGIRLNVIVLLSCLSNSKNTFLQVIISADNYFLNIEYMANNYFISDSIY